MVEFEVPGAAGDVIAMDTGEELRFKTTDSC